VEDADRFVVATLERVAGIVVTRHEAARAALRAAERPELRRTAGAVGRRAVRRRRLGGLIADFDWRRRDRRARRARSRRPFLDARHDAGDRRRARGAADEAQRAEHYVARRAGFDERVLGL